MFLLLFGVEKPIEKLVEKPDTFLKKLNLAKESRFKSEMHEIKTKYENILNEFKIQKNLWI